MCFQETFIARKCPTYKEFIQPCVFVSVIVESQRVAMKVMATQSVNIVQ